MFVSSTFAVIAAIFYRHSFSGLRSSYVGVIVFQELPSGKSRFWGETDLVGYCVFLEV